VQLILLVKKTFKIALQQTYNAVNYRLGWSAQCRHKFHKSKLNSKT